MDCLGKRSIVEEVLAREFLKSLWRHERPGLSGQSEYAAFFASPAAQDLFGFQDHRAIDHLAVHRDCRAIRGVRSVDDARRPRDLFSGRPKTCIHQRHLFRMYAELGAEAETLAAKRV